MKKITYHVMLLFTLLFAGNAYAQSCAVHIEATDDLICSGENVTLTAYANGPDVQLMGSNTAGNNQRGNMFDIVATNSVTILGFDASPMGNTTIEIYYKAGTWNGFANTPSAWTFVGSAPVPYSGGFSQVNVPVNVTIPAGQTYAFYITSNSTLTSLNYSNGTAVGNVYSADANITFLEGGGLDYPFTQGTGAVYQPRVWNGNIHYAIADLPGTTYTWGGGQTTMTVNAAPTTTTEYTVQVNSIPGCPAVVYDTLDVVVSIPPVSGGNDQTVCFGDEVMLYGEGAEDYAWSNGVTDSVAFVAGTTTTYTLTGTDSIGCVVTDDVTVTVNPLPLVFAGNDFAVCQGESATLAGQANDTYTWDNGVTNNVAFVPAATDTYTVVGVDANGCQDTDEITVTVNQNPVVSAGPDLDLCTGVEHTFSGSGAVTYDWDNNVTDGTPVIPMNATYTVVGTDANGCTGTDEMEVTLHTIMASIYASGSTLTAGTLVDMTVQWINCSNLSIIPGETDVIYEPELTGSYAVIIEDNVYGCVDTSNCVMIDFTGINEMLEAELSVYPVPTIGKVTVASTGAAIERVELIDLLGQVLESAAPNALQTDIDLSGYAANTFFVRVYRNGEMALLKVVKN